MPVATPIEHMDGIPRPARRGRSRRVSVVAFVGKGGSGKSTLAINVAVVLSQLSCAVVLLDLDPANSSVSRWANLRTSRSKMLLKALVPITVVSQAVSESQSAAFARALSEAERSSCPVTLIIDMPGGDRQRINDAVWDHVDLPYLPAEPTLMSVGATARLKRGFSDRSNRPVSCIVNRWAQDRRRADAVTALGNNCVARTCVRGYVVYADAYAAGLGVTEYAGRHKAADDMRSLAVDMIGALRGVAPYTAQVGSI